MLNYSILGLGAFLKEGFYDLEDIEHFVETLSIENILPLEVGVFIQLQDLFVQDRTSRQVFDELPSGIGDLTIHVFNQREERIEILLVGR